MITKYIATYKKIPYYENEYARIMYPSKYTFKNIFHYWTWYLKTKFIDNYIIIITDNNDSIIFREY